MIWVRASLCHVKHFHPNICSSKNTNAVVQRFIIKGVCCQNCHVCLSLLHFGVKCFTLPTVCYAFCDSPYCPLLSILLLCSLSRVTAAAFVCILVSCRTMCVHSETYPILSARKNSESCQKNYAHEETGTYSLCRTQKTVCFMSGLERALPVLCCCVLWCSVVNCDGTVSTFARLCAFGCFHNVAKVNKQMHHNPALASSLCHLPVTLLWVI